jgi:hypothetical protein
MPGDVVTLLAGNLLALVAFWIFPLRTRLALDRLEHRPALCAVAGILGWVILVPLAIVLLCTIVLAPLILLETVAAIAGVFVGTAAIALLAGRRLYEKLDPNGRPSEALILILGIVLLTAAELLPVVGYVVAAVVGIVGLGTAILAFVPDRRLAAPSRGSGTDLING